jgi:hypothetical protein
VAERAELVRAKDDNHRYGKTPCVVATHAPPCELLVASVPRVTSMQNMGTPHPPSLHSPPCTNHTPHPSHPGSSLSLRTHRFPYVPPCVHSSRHGSTPTSPIVDRIRLQCPQQQPCAHLAQITPPFTRTYTHTHFHSTLTLTHHTPAS